jgi:serine/threonine protein kinase/Tol biopolymer transport system component
LDSKDWADIKEIFSTALALSPEDRKAFVARLNQPVREEIISLLSAYEEDSQVLEQPLITSSGALLGRAIESQFEREQIGRYKIKAEIGRGGMGAVYRATVEGEPDREYAIKIIRPELNHVLLIRRFRQELRILQTVRHPFIASVVDAGTTEEGEPYFVMDLVEGLPVNEYCDSNVLGLKERLVLFEKICQAVSAAHGAGVIHRDLKPSNVLVTKAGDPRLLDFGIAKLIRPDEEAQTAPLTATMQHFVTPEYASPEQICGDSVTTTADVYSLGVLLYELLTSHRPFDVTRRAPDVIARAVVEQDPIKPSSRIERLQTKGKGDSNGLTAQLISAKRCTTPKILKRRLRGKLDNIVLHALAKQPGDRYQTVEEFAEDIRRFIEDKPVLAHGKSLAQQLRGLAANKRLRLVAISCGSAILIGEIGLLFHEQRMETFDFGNARLAALYPADEEELQPTISPDGKQIAFVRGPESHAESQINICPFQGMNCEAIAAEGARFIGPAWSSDGSHLAFMRVDQYGSSLWTCPVASLASQRQIAMLRTRGALELGRPITWTRDNKALIVSDLVDAETLALFRIDLHSGTRAQLTKPPQNTIGDTSPRVSPDGKQLAFIRMVNKGAGSVHIQSLADGKSRVLPFDSVWLTGLSWSRSQRSLIVSASTGGQSGLWVISARTGARQRLPVSGGGFLDPEISGDGKRLVYSTRNLDANIWRLTLKGYTHVAENQAVVKTPAVDSDPSVSPDSKSIVFSTNYSGTDQLWISTVEGRDKRQLTNLPEAFVDMPSWSPDGRSILFVASDKSPVRLFVIPASGGTPRRLTLSTTAKEIGGTWSRDRKSIYFTSDQSGRFEIWRSKGPGADPVQVTTAGGQHPFESSDGRYVYYAKRDAGGIFRKRVNGGPENKVLAINPEDWGNWVLASQGIYYVSGDRKAGLYYFNLHSGQTTLVQKLGWVPAGEQSVSLSPDNRYFFYTQIDDYRRRIMSFERE